MVTLACEQRRICFLFRAAENTGDAISKETLIRNLQFEKLMPRRISFITCLMNKPGNQVASLDLLTASSECRLLPPDCV